MGGIEDEHAPKRIRQLMHSEWVSEGLNRALRCDEMLDIIEALIGPDISLYHSKLLMKAARDARRFRGIKIMRIGNETTTRL